MVLGSWEVVSVTREREMLDARVGCGNGGLEVVGKS